MSKIKQSLIARYGRAPSRARKPSVSVTAPDGSEENLDKVIRSGSFDAQDPSSPRYSGESVVKTKGRRQTIVENPLGRRRYSHRPSLANQTPESPLSSGRRYSHRPSIAHNDKEGTTDKFDNFIAQKRLKSGRKGSIFSDAYDPSSPRSSGESVEKRRARQSTIVENPLGKRRYSHRPSLAYQAPEYPGGTHRRGSHRPSLVYQTPEYPGGTHRRGSHRPSLVHQTPEYPGGTHRRGSHRPSMTPEVNASPFGKRRQGLSIAPGTAGNMPGHRRFSQRERVSVAIGPEEAAQIISQRHYSQRPSLAHAMEAVKDARKIYEDCVMENAMFAQRIQTLNAPMRRLFHRQRQEQDEVSYDLDGIYSGFPLYLQ